MTSHPSTLARGNQKSTDLTPPSVPVHELSHINKANLIDNTIVPHSYRECVDKPVWIQRKHWQEWRESGVNPGLIRLLVRSLDLQGAIDFLYKYAPRLKTDRSQFQAGVRRQIEKLTPGWSCHYFDWQGAKLPFGKFKPNTPVEYGDGKPSKYLNTYGVGAAIGFFPVTLKEWQLASELNGVALPEKVQVKDTGEAGGFWSWVLENKIPIVIGEGEKKTACLLSHGIAAICLPGVNSLYRTVNLSDPTISEVDATRIRKYLDTCYVVKDSLSETIKAECKALYEFLQSAEVVEKKTKEAYDPTNPKKDKKVRYIVPELLPFVLAGIDFTFCFDQDEKESTQRHVGQALRTAARLLEAFGCGVNKVSWYYPEKGIDDVWNAHGSEAILEIFQSKESVLTKYKNPIFVDSQLLGKVEGIGFDNLEESYRQIVAWISPKGTGKSKAMGDLVQSLFNKGYKILSLTHRIELGKQNANNWGITHKGEKDLTGGNALGLCVDSLLTSKGFKVGDWCGDSYLLIDEVEQVINHLLFSNTLAANRAEIYENFISVVRQAKGILLSDAYLSQKTIDLLAKLCNGTPKIKTVVNTYKPDKKIPLVVYERAADLIAVLDENLATNPDYRCLIQTDSVTGSKGTNVLFEKYSEKFPHDQILQFDRVTTRLKGNPANGLPKFLDGLNSEGAKNTIDDFLCTAKMVLASPVWGTGVSLGEQKTLFGDVFLLLNGVQDLLSTGQNFNRYRRDCTRHLYIPQWGLNRFGGGETNKVELLKSLQQNAAVAAANILKNLTENQKTEYQNALQQNQVLSTLSNLNLQRQLIDKDDAFYLLQDHALSRMCEHNKAQYNLRGALLELLEAEGIWDVSFVEFDPENEAVKERNTEINKELNGIKKSQFEAKVKAIASTEIPVVFGSDLEALKNLTSTTKTQNLIIEKSEATLAYPVLGKPEKMGDSDFALGIWEYVLKDKALYSKLRRLYYLTEGREFLAERDFKKSLNHFLKGKVNLPGFVKSQLHYQIVALDFCGVSQFFDVFQVFTQANLSDWYKALLPYRKQIKNVLGVSMVNESAHKKWQKANRLEAIPENDLDLDPTIHKCICFAKALLGKLGLGLACVARKGVTDRDRLYVLNIGGEKFRRAILSDWLEGDQDKKALDSQAVYRYVQGSGQNSLKPLQDAALGVTKNQNQKVVKNCQSEPLEPLRGAGLEPRPRSPLYISPTTEKGGQPDTQPEAYQETNQETNQPEAYQETNQETNQPEAYQETNQETNQPDTSQYDDYLDTQPDTSQYDDYLDTQPDTSQYDDYLETDYLDNPDEFESDWEGFGD